MKGCFDTSKLDLALSSPMTNGHGAILEKCPTVPLCRAGTMGQTNPTSVKVLALSVLAAGKGVPPHRTASVTQGTAKDTCHAATNIAVAACGSTGCAGCYEVEPGVRIHPPKSSDEWKEWLLRWEPTGMAQ
jgi:hypothetical protein